MTNYTLIADTSGVRLDRFVTDRLSDFSRSRLQQLIKRGLVKVNGSPARASQKVNTGDSIEVTVPAPVSPDMEPNPIPISVVYEDEDMLVIDKSPGLPVHPSAGHSNDTLVNAILARCPDLPGIGDTLRPGIVHRLDKDTSGLIVVAKTEAAFSSLQKQIKHKEVKKRYLVLVKGHISPVEGIIEAPIGRHPHLRQKMAVVSGGREARTYYRLVRRYKDYDLLEVTLDTGRTHQIRVHLSSIGFPVVGDSTYGIKVNFLDRQFLHACFLGLHMSSTGEWVEFKSNLPEDLSSALSHIRT